jgi:hypothetical protein
VAAQTSLAIAHGVLAPVGVIVDVFFLFFVVGCCVGGSLVILFSCLYTEDLLEMGAQVSLQKGRISCFSSKERGNILPPHVILARRH